MAFHIQDQSSQPSCHSETLLLKIHPNQCGRRTFLSIAGGFYGMIITPSASTAFPFGDDSKDRRQKELCLVNILRLQYWATSTAMILASSSSSSSLKESNLEQRKKAYLEARLGAKAMVA
eukprot:CAMPEP_0170316210 /NCGR_PEP_ID=MMETSP0116_2-20130129/58727_1 /TAXON_ID=400756 /ORGANISM="Durinskia baltica, Strain CSIRO CS-38" /LENGTH=119 /DNA_ID=CAMNT_0010568757 /DNA_START=136 /DNA_END=492 /DNA_ORIENTATION=-